MSRRYMQVDTAVRARTRQEIALAAQQLRARLRLSDSLAPNVIEILEFKLPMIMPNFRFTIVDDRRLGTEVLACSRSEPPEIILSESTYRDAIAQNPRARFTVAHELGHVILNHIGVFQRNNFSGRNKTVSKHRDAEWQANQFAAEFLLPEDIVSKFDNPKDLGRYCKVSEAAAAIRVRELAAGDVDEKVVVGFRELLARLRPG